MSDLSPALLEELAKALNEAGWTCFEGSHEPANYDSCPDCQRVCKEQVAALAPILSRALAEAWVDGFRAHHDFARGFGITAPVNPYLTEKEQSSHER